MLSGGVSGAQASTKPGKGKDGRTPTKRNGNGDINRGSSNDLCQGKNSQNQPGDNATSNKKRTLNEMLQHQGPG